MPLPSIDPSCAVPIDLHDVEGYQQESFLWYDAERLTLAGKAWMEESRRYERFPRRAEGKIPEKPWRQSLACAGLSLRFESDADYMFVRSVDYDGKTNLNQTSFNSPSLYVKHGGRWRWLGIAKQVNESGVHKLINGRIPRETRSWMVYLPLGRGMTKLELGIPKDAFLRPSEPRTEKPVVFYGTSINHGSAACRPGTNHVALVERHFDYPVINLGLSGSAVMEPEVIDLVNEIDARVFVLDCLPNMVAEQVRERFEPAVRKIRAAHPDTPIVIVDSITYEDGFLVTNRRERYVQSNAAQQEGFARLQAAGVPGLHYVFARELFAEDDEATFDGTHPNDLGFRKMADTLIKVLAPWMPY